MPGCSTGEEAYSIAMLLQERMEELKLHFKVNIFATDIDREAIEHARAGVYPSSIIADVSPERLAHFFVEELPDGSTYRIHKKIRDMLIFSEHDLIKDPPFSKLDLISCRNLLIYISAELQERLMSVFHYALNPGGMLVLGSSESVGDFGNVFATIDRKAKIYQRKADDFGPRRVGFARMLPHPPERNRTAAGERSPLSDDTPHCARSSSGLFWSTTPRLARWSTTAATYFTCWAALAATWNRRQARPA